MLASIVAMSAGVIGNRVKVRAPSVSSIMISFGILHNETHGVCRQHGQDIRHLTEDANT